ncbi:uncharacterized protein BDZ83DRAFT_579540 [Colletotrichum acutatum]|uniref:Mg2+ transporter n=1 Tax=Glomerella acutata TaxID=27357 RepID=A0AAD8UGR4_GLOAC|nr:uncharacterized protein BDZ83DRAFT_579540 [Colletotrichum acutatum]KAK1723977.1 hypothetical protein BDZ83DRAFT_579540 [Colletotrichum acutatum]
MSQYEPSPQPRRRGGQSLFPYSNSSRASAQSLRSQYSSREAQTAHLVQLIEEFRKGDPIYEPVPPTPPPRAPGRQGSQRSQRSRRVVSPFVRFQSPLERLTSPLERFASPLESYAPRRRAKTPLSVPVVYDMPTTTATTQQQNIIFPAAIPEEAQMQTRHQSPPQEPEIVPVPSIIANEETESDEQSFDLDGFPMPPDFTGQEYLTPVEEVEDWVDLEETSGKVYAFDPARSSSDPTRDDDGSDLDIPFSDDSTLRGEEPPLSRALHVYQSMYTGEGVLGGVHSAALDVVYDTKRRRQSLFRWLHVQQDMMNFDEFTNEISRALSESEQNDIRKLLSDVRKNFSKTIRTSRDTTVKHMEPSHLELALQRGGDQAKGSTTRKRSVTWLCIPYFSLEEYSGILATGNPGAYPPLTLLQLAFSRNSQKRDMLQATRQIGNGGENMCFHIRQLWCIVLDNSLLITCGSMYEEALRGETVTMTSEPARDTALGADTGRILIQHGESVMWSFPLEECRTWFAFIAHFADFWPKAVRFHFNGRLLTEARWWKVLQFARTSRRNVVINMETCAPPQLPPSGILRPIKQGLSSSAGHSSSGLQLPRSSAGNRMSFPPGQSNKTNEMFHVFSWAEARPPSPMEGPNFIVLQKQLSEVEEFLTAETNGPDRRAYLEAEMSTRNEVFEYLEQQGARMQDTKKSWKKQDYEERVDIFNAADSLFRFFLPPLFDGPTTERFWGAVMNLVRIPQPEATEGESHPNNLDKTRREAVYANAPTVRKALRQMALPVIAFKSILSHAEPTDRVDIDVPLELIRAWLHLVMGLIYASHETHMWEDHLEVADTLVKNGMKHMMERLSSLNLLERSSVLPLEVVSLISYGLLSNTSGKYAGISDTYSEYLRSLENEIANGQSDISYQQRINFLRQEVSVIDRTIAAQNSVFSSILASRQEGSSAAAKLQRSARTQVAAANYHEAASLKPHLRMGRSSGRHGAGDDEDVQVLLEPMVMAASAEVSDFYKLPSTDAAGFRDLLAAECTQLLERRSRDFEEYAEQADVLEQTNLNNAAVTKDRQEQAIYAFTIVTIIFLPLSAVSSVFGMNSSDIRDMEAGQWLYWATAIPVTILTIVLGLWWMGEMGHLVDWVLRKVRGDDRLGPKFPASLYGGGDMSEKPGYQQHAGIEVINAPRAVYSRPMSAKQSFTRRLDRRRSQRT